MDVGDIKAEQEAERKAALKAAEGEKQSFSGSDICPDNDVCFHAAVFPSYLFFVPRTAEDWKQLMNNHRMGRL